MKQLLKKYIEMKQLVNVIKAHSYMFFARHYTKLCSLKLTNNLFLKSGQYNQFRPPFCASVLVLHQTGSTLS